MATVRAPRSRARRSPGRGGAAHGSRRVVSARWPSPTTTTRRAGSRAVGVHVRHLRRPCPGTSRRPARRRAAPPAAASSAARPGRAASCPRRRRPTTTASALDRRRAARAHDRRRSWPRLRSARAPAPRRIMSISPSVVSSRSTSSTSTHRASAASLAGAQRPRLGERQVVDQHPMIADAALRHRARRGRGCRPRRPRGSSRPHSSAISRAHRLRASSRPARPGRRAGSTCRSSGALAAPDEQHAVARRGRRRRRRRAG